MVGSDVFLLPNSPFLGDEFVSFQGCNGFFTLKKLPTDFKDFGAQTFRSFLLICWRELISEHPEAIHRVYHQVISAKNDQGLWTTMAFRNLGLNKGLISRMGGRLAIAKGGTLRFSWRLCLFFEVGDEKIAQLHFIKLAWLAGKSDFFE